MSQPSDTTLSPASTSSTLSHNQPPPLNYSLRDRKKSIAIAWTFIIFDSCIIAVLLFYPLWFASSLSRSTVMAIVTSCVGAVSLLQWVWRGRLLLLKHDFYRPLGATRGWFDTFMWAYTLCVGVIVVELVIGTSLPQPIVRLCSMPMPSLVFTTAILMMIGDLAYALNVRTPIRVSSQAPGEISRPGVYSMIEDVVAVEGGAGRPFREALDKRYQASPEFRSMLFKLSVFWSVSGLIIAGATTAVIFTTSDAVGFGIGWCVPFVWAGIWTLITFPWVSRMLRQEREAWQARHLSAAKA